MFLNGITRQRVIALLRADGVRVRETTLRPEDFASADEIFVTGNIAKVMPVTRLQERRMPGAPVTERARALYWEYAHEGGAAPLPLNLVICSWLQGLARPADSRRCRRAGLPILRART